MADTIYVALITTGGMLVSALVSGGLSYLILHSQSKQEQNKIKQQLECEIQKLTTEKQRNHYWAYLKSLQTFKNNFQNTNAQKSLYDFQMATNKLCLFAEKNTTDQIILYINALMNVAFTKISLTEEQHNTYTKSILISMRKDLNLSHSDLDNFQLYALPPEIIFPPNFVK